MKSIKIKLVAFFGIMALALGFLFCFNALSVNAEELPQDEQQEETEPEAEETNPEETTDKATEEVVDLFINRLKNLSWQDAEAIIGWVVTYLIVNFGVILSFAIAFIIKKSKEIQISETFQKAVAKLNAEQQAKVQELIADFNAKLVDLKADIDKVNEEHKEELKQAKNEETKEISQALGNILNSINKE